MLTISHNSSSHTGLGLSRRQWLTVGGLSLGGLTLPGLLEAQSKNIGLSEFVRDKSIVFLFLQGGPSQFETFEPKMKAPSEIRSINGEIQTAIPGVTFGATFPLLAERAKRISIVRSFASKNADHQNYLSVLGGGSPLKTAMGTLYARAAGPNHPQSGVPTNTVIKAEAVGNGVTLGKNFETQSLEKVLTAAAALGPLYAPFDPSGGGQLLENLQLNVSKTEFEDRRQLLVKLDGLRRSVDNSPVLEDAQTYQQRAYDVIGNGIASAFDLSQESPKTLERYDTSALFKLEEVHKWGDMRRSSNLLGRQLLLARRLCENGCRFVTVFDAGWDMHSNNNSPKNLGGMNWLGRQLDHAVAAFLDDLQERGLSDQILLVVTGEMGRTPKLNKNGGRDHWGDLTPLLVAGGGLPMGQVIGQSDDQGGKPATTPYTPPHLLHTVMHTLFDIGQLRVSREVPTQVVDAISGGQPIRELVT